MTRTALILASAVAFDLGVMAVAAQAQQQADPPPLTTSTAPVEGTLDWMRAAPDGSTAGNPTSPGPRGAEVGVPGGPGGCVLRPGQPVPGGDGGPCGPAAIRTQVTQLRVEYLRIDAVNTIQACRARQGEVVRHQGAQQCRLPPPPPAAVGNPTLNPTRRPGGIPPRN